MQVKPVLSLNDIIALHYKQIDIVHKLWTYLWLAGAAVLTIASNHNELAPYLLVGFLLFSVANMRLVFLAQSEACLSEKALKAVLAEFDPPLNAAVASVIEAVKPWAPYRVLVGHIFLSALVVYTLVAIVI